MKDVVEFRERTGIELWTRDVDDGAERGLEQLAVDLGGCIDEPRKRLPERCGQRERSEPGPGTVRARGAHPLREWLRRQRAHDEPRRDRKSTRLNSSHSQISYAVFCLKK